MTRHSTVGRIVSLVALTVRMKSATARAEYPNRGRINTDASSSSNWDEMSGRNCLPRAAVTMGRTAPE